MALSWIVSALLALYSGIRTLWEKKKEADTVQVVTKENKELKAENAGLIEAEVHEDRKENVEKEYKDAKGFKAKLKVLSDRYRYRSGRK